MFVRNFSKEIVNAITQDDREKFWELTGEAVNYYAKKINDSINVMFREDIPYIVVALDGFRESILECMDPEERKCTEEIVDMILSKCEITKETKTHAGPITETAAREIYEQMRGENSCEP